MPAPCERGIFGPRRGHQIAQVVGDHEGQLAMGEHGGLGFARSAGGEEEPRRVVALHGDGGWCRAAMAGDQRLIVRADGNRCIHMGRTGGGMVGELRPAEQEPCPGRACQPCQIVRRKAEIGGLLFPNHKWQRFQRYAGTGLMLLTRHGL